MYRSILVPLDGSPAAEQALPWALGLARRFEAALQIVHVHVPGGGAYAEAGLYDGIVDGALREQMQAYLDGVIQRLSKVTQVSLRSAMVEGFVVEAINSHAKSSGVDLIVMTTQGRGPLARFWFGSVADALLRQATIPMLLVRPQESPAEWTQEPEWASVLVPLDGSQLAEQILEPATALAAATKADVKLLYVVQQLVQEGYVPRSSQVTSLLDQLREAEHQEQVRAEKYLEKLAKRLRGPSFRVETRVVSHIRPAVAILDEASSDGVHVIALATHGRGGFNRILLGSVADKVVRGATTPVFVYRPVGEFDSVEE